MCGITGIFGCTNDNDLTRVVGVMADSLVHRGPDDCGVWSDETAHIAFGHRRLSVIDLSQEGHQPMHSACGRYIIVFNGEIYNHKALRKELEYEFASNHLPKGNGVVGWRGQSDTETLLSAFSRWGIEATLNRVVGMFAIAVWDRSDRRLCLVRDRMGEKPLY
ncbi:MAG: asparagine synthetase B, partial [Lentimicrobiaceae bacterium]|nr:asparagine synthetase B [Lentimicrobiaceae bacterium]